MLERRTANVVAVSVVATLVVGALVAWWLQGRLPGKTSGLDEACAGKTYDGAAPYEGAAPHPIAVFIESDLGPLEQTVPYPPDDDAWELFSPDDPADVQLVACATVDGEQSLSAEDSCAFGNAGSVTIPMVSATYQVRVYELRTHREVRSVTLEGLQKPCPHAIKADERPTRILSEPTDVQWRKALGDLVGQDR